MRRFVIAVLVLALASIAQAGQLVPKHVSVDAQWFGHINVEKIRSLPMLKDCKALWQGDSRRQERFKEMSKKLGINPMEDLLGVTLYSTQYEGRVGVCLFYIKSVNQKKMVAFFKEKCPHHEDITYGDRTLYRWTIKHHSKEMALTGAFGNETLIVIGADTKHVKVALDVLDGKKDGLEKDSPLVAGVAKRAMFVSRANNVPEAYRKTTKCPVLRNCSAAFAQWAENKGQITGKYLFTTDSEETAQNYKAIVDGFMAMAKLRYGDSKVAMKVIDGLKCTAKANSFRVVWKTKTDDLQAALRQIMKDKCKSSSGKKDELEDIVYTAVSASPHTLDFTRPNAMEAWQTVNDGVMGGISEGNVRMTKDKTMEFFGNLSLENNGGFASTRTRRGKLDLSQYEALMFKVRGDGRTYYFNIHVPTQQVAFSYRAEFITEKDKWQEVRIPLKDFQATSFGREVAGAAPLDAKNIQSIGFLLSDKKAGPFKLEVAWIKGVSKSGKY